VTIRYNQQPTTNNQQPTTNNQQPTTNQQLVGTYYFSTQGASLLGATDDVDDPEVRGAKNDMLQQPVRIQQPTRSTSNTSKKKGQRKKAPNATSDFDQVGGRRE
jgi:hypothetical protein